MNTSSPNARLRPFRPVPFGRYTLLSQLATGGMGEICKVRALHRDILKRKNGS